MRSTLFKYKVQQIFFTGYPLGKKPFCTHQQASTIQASRPFIHQSLVPQISRM